MARVTLTRTRAPTAVFGKDLWPNHNHKSNCGQSGSLMAAQWEERERLKLVSPTCKRTVSPSLCCGYIVSPGGPSLATLSKGTSVFSLAFLSPPCIYHSLVSPVHPSIHPFRLLLMYCFDFLPLDCEPQESRDHVCLICSNVLST